MKELHNKVNVLLVLCFWIFIFQSCRAKAAAPSCPLPKNCYATCHQFESALLVGCYLADRDKSKTHKEHEDFCKKLAKELMGKDSGCSK